MSQHNNFKFTLYVGQRECLRLGITNINQAIIFDLLAHANTWAEAIIVDNDIYYWVARQKISEQLPILGLKPDTIYRHLKALDKLGVIKHIKVGKKDCMKLTEKGKSYYVGNKSELSEATMSEINPNSEINPTKLGNKSENNSEINPTYNTTIYNNTTNDNLHGDVDVEVKTKTKQKTQVPFKRIISLYHSILPNNPELRKLTATRKGYIKQRWIEDLPSLESWEKYFTYISESRFLTGKTEGTDDKPPFLPDLEWLSRPNNFAKIYEGKYHREVA